MLLPRYNEGCVVLYQTNTVFIESAPLIDGLLRQGIDPGAPILTGPGIQLVRTLHLKVEFMLFYPNPEKAAEERSRFAQALDLLPRAFPDLQPSSSSSTATCTTRTYQHR